MTKRKSLEPEPLEPDAVWTAEEWADRELTAWMNMPPGPERTRLKAQAFQAAYGGGRRKFKVQGTATGRFPRPPDFQMGDQVHLNIEEFLRGGDYGEE